jgi:hypothetical protein
LRGATATTLPGTSAAIDRATATAAELLLFMLGKTSFESDAVSMSCTLSSLTSAACKLFLTAACLSGHTPVPPLMQQRRT